MPCIKKVRYIERDIYGYYQLPKKQRKHVLKRRGADARAHVHGYL